jgi:hypothetical protein
LISAYIAVTHKVLDKFGTTNSTPTSITDVCMHTLKDLTALLEKYVARIPSLNLDGDDLEEYSTVLLRLQNQIETGEPSARVVSECLAWLAQFESQAA